MKNLIFLWMACSAAAFGADARRITLEEAIALARKQNAGLAAARFRVDQNAHHARAARADYFPRLTNEANLSQVVDMQRIEIPRGALGVYSATGPIPAVPLTLYQGGTGLFYTYTTLGQPLTQMFRIREGYRVARADTKQSEAELRKAEQDVSYGVSQLYFGLLIGEKQRAAAERRIAAAQEKLRESRDAVTAGAVLEVAAIGSRAGVLESRHALLAVEDQMADLRMELNEVLGLPLDTRLELVQPEAAELTAVPLEEFTKAALASNPEVGAAEALVEKAHAGVRAARAEYIPDLSAFGRHIYQSSVPFLARNNGMFGFSLNWNVFDFGKRHETVAERQAGLAAAEANLRRLREHALVDVEKSYRKLERARQMIEVAREALALRRESERIANDQFSLGVIPPASFEESRAARARAEADALQAELGYRLARAELDRAAGRL